MVPEEYEKHRAQWLHEDELINHRLGWLLTSQTILFAGYGVILQAQVQGKSPIEFGSPHSRIDNMLRMIAILGRLTSVLLLLSIFAAVLALRAIKRHGRELYPDNTAFYLGVISPLGLPLVFFVAWVFLLVQ